VFVFRPAQVVYEVIDGSLEHTAPGHGEFGAVRTLIVIQSAEEDERLRVVVPQLAVALPREAPAKIVDEGGP